MKVKTLKTRGWKALVAVVLPFILLVGGCSKPYFEAQKAYWNGESDEAIEILTPDYEKALKKNSKDRNLFLWDMGVYYFTVGNFASARECFHQSVQEYARLAGAAETGMSMMKSSSSMTYAGDPVEVSVAYLFVGLCYYYEGDFQNAMIALRRSMEEDQSEEAGREGDMGITSFVQGELYSRLERWGDATVAYRRAVEFYPKLVPAWAGLYYSLRAQRRTGELAGILASITELASEEYAKAVEEGNGEGIVLIVYGDKASPVKGDFFLGAFRTRSHKGYDATRWNVGLSGQDEGYALHMADDMHTHFKSQGGTGDEAKKQTSRAVAAKGMSYIPCVGLFAPDTSADVRYWVTLPLTFTVGYMPITAGSYDLNIQAWDKKDKALGDFAKSWQNVTVAEKARTMIMASSYNPQLIP